MPLTLASGSPRRHGLLTTLGVAFEVAVPDVDESVLPAEGPEAYVERVAAAKAAAVAGRPVVAADTTVVLDGRILGKPAGPDEARRMLEDLAGREHVVHTAVAAIGPAGTASRVSSATVRMAPMTGADIAWYVATGEPLDKAGAYGLQGIGGVFVESVDGDPHAVIGLPVVATRAACRAAGFELLPS
jgi:septum formation protein